MVWQREVAITVEEWAGKGYSLRSMRIKQQVEREREREAKEAPPLPPSKGKERSYRVLVSKQ